jgi:hypothetical protein
MIPFKTALTPGTCCPEPAALRPLRPKVFSRGRQTL